MYIPLVLTGASWYSPARHIFSAAPAWFRYRTPYAWQRRYEWEQIFLYAIRKRDYYPIEPVRREYVQRLFSFKFKEVSTYLPIPSYKAHRRAKHPLKDRSLYIIVDPDIPARIMPNNDLCLMIRLDGYPREINTTFQSSGGGARPAEFIFIS